MAHAIKKYTLSNGLTVITCTVGGVPKVSSQIWYNVGSKNELDGQRGMAHLLEHMIFKGTNRLSESDINLISSKFSGYTNAFTSYDYTGYLFDFPKRYWEQSLDLFADCMSNCTFKQEHLNSEFKAVIQELKMYRDDYDETLLEALMARIFSDHPYGKSIIGTLQDISYTTPTNLKQFYKQYYSPSNATLVVVGDVAHEHVIEQAEKYFGSLEDKKVEHKSYYHNKDIAACSVTLHRDVANPTLLLSWVMPGMRSGNDYYLDLLTWVVGRGKSSRLYDELVIRQKLAQEVEAFISSMFEYSLFCIRVQVNDVESIEKVKNIVAEQMQQLQNTGISDSDLTRATEQVRMQHAGLFDDTQELAYTIGEYFLATGNEQYVLNYVGNDKVRVKEKLTELIQHLSPYQMHVGSVLPLAESDCQIWNKLQEQIDAEEANMLARRNRISAIEPGLHVNSLKDTSPQSFVLPTYEKITLDTGLSVVWHQSKKSEKIEIILELSASHCYDPKQRSGLFEFTSDMLQEGTQRLSAQEFANFVESRGISIECTGNRIYLSALKNNFAVALELLADMLVSPRFADADIERVRKRILYELDDYWDDPNQFVAQLAREQVYRDHPYAQLGGGTSTTVQQITKEELLDCWRRLITPQGAHLAIVGDAGGNDISALCKKIFGAWGGPRIEPIKFPFLQPVQAGELLHEINRDQIVLGLAGLSVGRMDSAYDALYLFDQVFTGGKKGSMSSRLFELRERSGLFYTIGGSLTYQADEQPGMMFIRTIVSQDQVSNAEAAIKRVADEAPETVTAEEVEHAKAMYIDNLHESTESNSSIAHMLLFVQRYNLPQNYFEMLDQRIRDMRSETVSEVASKLLNHQDLTVIKIGRL